MISDEMLEKLKVSHDILKGPFGFCGLRTTLDWINEYTEFCASAMPQLFEEITALRKIVGAADVLGDSVYPIINLDCEVHGTCKYCLADGRGTHTEQLEYNLERFDKALKQWRNSGG